MSRGSARVFSRLAGPCEAKEGEGRWAFTRCFVTSWEPTANAERNRDSGATSSFVLS